jgi:hypothetical protein
MLLTNWETDVLSGQTPVISFKIKPIVLPQDHSSIRPFLCMAPTSTGYFVFGWDGTRIHNASSSNDLFKLVPDGEYVIKLSVLKALGSEKNPDHWEHWTSPAFFIARP